MVYCTYYCFCKNLLFTFIFCGCRRTPLQCAAYGGFVNCMSVLIEHKADVNARDRDVSLSDLRISLHYLCNVLINVANVNFLYLTNSCRLELNFITKNWWYYVFDFIKGNAKYSKLQPASLCMFQGMTALHWGCSKGHLDAVKLLIEYQAFPNHMEMTEDRLVQDSLWKFNKKHFQAQSHLKKKKKK